VLVANKLNVIRLQKNRDNNSVKRFFAFVVELVFFGLHLLLGIKAQFFKVTVRAALV